MARKKKTILYDISFVYTGSTNNIPDYHKLTVQQVEDLRECILSEREWFDYNDEDENHWYINLKNVSQLSIEACVDE